MTSIQKINIKSNINMEFNKKKRTYFARVLCSWGMTDFYITLIFYLFFLVILNIKNYAGNIILLMSFSICTIFSLIEHVYYIEYIGILKEKLIIKAWKYNKVVINQEYDISKVRIYVDGTPMGFYTARLTIKYNKKKIFSQLERLPWTRDEFIAIEKEVKRISPPKYIKYE
jgi:hypothetical protein